ncbi:hypothetical protein C2G38_2246090 [Gigaspora rosea]|uniref:Uncharacterized protein n=1 Tax=Gigaspora rosea TaxID=44941 RepID=A0A397V9F5_9GLOM|nr:hypothetical protein C2G38_2246090 [Gigaspora rosea]
MKSRLLINNILAIFKCLFLTTGALFEGTFEGEAGETREEPKLEEEEVLMLEEEEVLVLEEEELLAEEEELEEPFEDMYGGYLSYLSPTKNFPVM